ncbi:dihydroorotate dehydrogenase [Tunturiibacter gelidiferens]|uniref:dihydroorotate dehydrogenase n=1 Tax=Tunturiibacter gelidiferens TaxID=3069689 RepID=UPI003D9B57AD
MSATARTKGPDMRVTVAGVEFSSPVIAASGTFGYGVEFEDIVSLDRIGGFVTKGLSRESMAGNPAPRIIETAAGMMNAIGLQNMGVRAFIAEKLPKLRKITGTVIIANVFGFTIEDCVEVIQALNDAPDVAMYELNASCPNTSHGGMVFGTDPPQLWELVARCKAAARRPLMVKLSPNVTDIGLMARVAADGELTRFHSSTPSSLWRLMLRRVVLVSPISPEDSPARRSSPLRCGWCMRFQRM